MQSFLEDITLNAADLSTADFRKKIQEPGVKAVLVMLTYFELALVTVMALSVQAPLWKPGGEFHQAFGSQGQMIQALALVLSLVALFLALAAAANHGLDSRRKNTLSIMEAVPRVNHLCLPRFWGLPSPRDMAHCGGVVFWQDYSFCGLAGAQAVHVEPAAHLAAIHRVLGDFPGYRISATT